MQEQFMKSWQHMLDRLTSWLDLAITNLPNLVIAIFVFSVAYWLSRNIQKWLSRPLSRLIKQTSLHYLITNAVATFIVMLGLFLALGILNLDTVLQSLLAGAGVAGLAVGLALKDSLSNIFSGVVLSVKDIINIDDYIETNGYSGEVKEITLRSTTIKESDNNMVMIPNDLVLTNPIKNYNLSERMRTTLKCRVDYQTDLRQARNIVINSIANNFPQQEGEVVEFHYLDFEKSSIEFQVRFWITAVNKTQLLVQKSEAIILLRETLQANQINIPLPIHNVQVSSLNDGASGSGSGSVWVQNNNLPE